MASVEGSERCATFTWEIENFDLLLETDPTLGNENLQYPVWKVEHNEGYIWCVLNACHMDSGIGVCMIRLQEVSVNVQCEAFIISSCGEISIKIFNNESFYIEKDAVFGDQKQSMLQNNTLTLRWRIRGETIKNQDLRICSVLNSIKYLWNIHQFNSFHSYGRFVEQGNFLLYVSLGGKSKGFTPMVVDMAPYAGRFVSFVYCKLSTINGCELIIKKQLENLFFPCVKWACYIENIPEKMERIDLQFRSLLSLHKVKPDNVSKAVPGSPSSARADDLLLLYREGTLSDATLNTEEKSFSAHRSILAARSSVFRAMFEKDEMNEGRSGVVDIDDVDSDTVDRMLVFLYGEKLGDVQWEEASALYYAADKYDVPSLKRRCVDILKAGLAVDNACDVLVLADTHSDEQLRKCVVDFISDHREVFSSSKWEKLEESNPRLTTKIFREVYVKEEK